MSYPDPIFISDRLPEFESPVLAFSSYFGWVIAEYVQYDKNGHKFRLSHAEDCLANKGPELYTFECWLDLPPQPPESGERLGDG